jgi:hypothetical protein
MAYLPVSLFAFACVLRLLDSAPAASRQSGNATQFHFPERAIALPLWNDRAQGSPPAEGSLTD